MNSNMAADDTRKRGGQALLTYLLLIFLLSIPFWVLGAIATGPLSAATPGNLPLSALAVFNPLIAALIMSYREGGSREVKVLLGKILDYRKEANKAWFAGAALLMPAVMVLSYVVMRLAGSPLPDPRVGPYSPIGAPTTNPSSPPSSCRLPPPWSRSSGVAKPCPDTGARKPDPGPLRLLSKATPTDWVE